jgi:hypothetical protein
LLSVSQKIPHYSPLIASQAFLKTGDLSVAFGAILDSKILIHHLGMISSLAAST